LAVVQARQIRESINPSYQEYFHQDQTVLDCQGKMCFAIEDMIVNSLEHR